jgi:hypothetical protein
MNRITKIIQETFSRKKKQEDVSDRPPDWKKTGTDLYNEMHSGEREFIPQKELEWAADYERSLIPSAFKFPKKGYVYEALEDIDVDIEIWYNAPGSGSEDGKIFKGEKIWIYYETGEREIEPCAHPIDYKKLEVRLVSKYMREVSFYAGYSIRVRTTTLNEKFKLIEKNYKPK